MLKQGAASPLRHEGAVPIESRALGTLAYIRASIESSGTLAVPGMAGILMGIVGILAAVLTAMPALASRWLETWLAAAATAFVVGGASMARQATRSVSTRYQGPARKFLLCLCPALLAGAVLTFALAQAGMQHLIPGMWLLLYGCAVLSASTVTSADTFRLIATMGALFIALGAVAFQLPASLHTLMLGAGFGALHLLFGILIGRARHGA